MDATSWRGGLGRSATRSIAPVADAVFREPLLSLPASIAPADAVRVIKARSSSWVRGRDRSFAWQSGYAVFSVSQSRAAQVQQYIARQQEHHTRIRFEDEMVPCCSATGWNPTSVICCADFRRLFRAAPFGEIGNPGFRQRLHPGLLSDDASRLGRAAGG